MRVRLTHNNPCEVQAKYSQDLTCSSWNFQREPGLRSRNRLRTESPGTIAELHDSHFGRHLNTGDVHRKVVEDHE